MHRWQYTYKNTYAEKVYVRACTVGIHTHVHTNTYKPHRCTRAHTYTHTHAPAHTHQQLLKHHIYIYIYIYLDMAKQNKNVLGDRILRTNITLNFQSRR